MEKELIYDVIVIGATFTAAGLLQKYGNKCLCLEKRPQGGYEFLNGLNFGYGYDEPLKSEEAEKLYKQFSEKKAFYDSRISLFDCAGVFYRLLENKNVMLNMNIVSVEKEVECFVVTAHGVSGFRTYRGKRVIDTTVHPYMVNKKTLNFLVNSENPERAELPSDLETEQCGYKDDILIKCEVPQDSGYIEARRKIREVAERLPSEYKIVLIADCFAYEVKTGYPAKENGIVYMPSVAYKNPVQAYDVGVTYDEGGVL